MSLGIEKAREHRGHGTHTEQCDRAVAQAVHENNELRAENERLRGHLKFAVDAVHAEARYQWEMDLRGAPGAQIVAQRMVVVETVIRNAVGGDL